VAQHKNRNQQSQGISQGLQINEPLNFEFSFGDIGEEKNATKNDQQAPIQDRHDTISGKKVKCCKVGPPEKNKRNQHLIEGQNQKYFESIASIAQEKSCRQRDYRVDYRQQGFNAKKLREVFRNELYVLGYVLVVEIVYAQIDQDIEHKAEIEQNKIKSVRLLPHPTLDFSIDTEQVKWLHKQVEKQYQPQAG
jgi:hypothetical protein